MAEEHYTTITTMGATYGIQTVRNNETGHWLASVNLLDASGEPVGTGFDEARFAITYGEQRNERDAILAAMQTIF